MVARIVTVVPDAGLHARPAARFVETVQAFDADVTVAPVDDAADAEGDDGGSASEAVDGGSMLAVTGLGVASGERVRLVAEGEDAEAALDALEAVLTTPEGEG